MKTGTLGGRVRRASCGLHQVPPWCFLQSVESLDAAVAMAVVALRITDPVGLLTLAWEMRLAREGWAR